MEPLLYKTPASWLECVLDDFNHFLADHASAEKKAAGMAVNMISHYPDRTALVETMTELAVEELSHFREVVRLLHARGATLTGDRKDPYVQQFRRAIRRGPQDYLTDQLLVAGIIEARGAERFGLIGEGIADDRLATFYRAIARSEQRHFALFTALASDYGDSDAVSVRTAELLAIEAEICAALPTRAVLH